MSRYDKYDPTDGGFRAPLAAATVAGQEWVAKAVGLDASGRVVLGAGNTGIIGVYVPHGLKAAGDIVDVMTEGEIVEMTGQTAGTVVSAAVADGTLGAAGVGKPKVGFTVEATRLVVRVHQLAS